MTGRDKGQVRRKVRFQIYRDGQADLKYLHGRTIAVIGYGSQGRAQALNLRDSGLQAIIGLPLRSKSRKLALKDGFEVYGTEQAADLGDVVSVLTPDHMHKKIYHQQLRPNLRPGKTLTFASGFSVHFELVTPPESVDVIMVAPHAPGQVMRKLFLQGKGVSCFVAVHQDYTGSAKKKALAYAKAIGSTRPGAFWTTFEDEAVGDLFGEQAVLCGGLSQLLTTGFEVLVEAGLPPENAYLECVHQLDHIVDTIKSYGIRGMFDRISQTAEFGSYLSGRRVISEKVKGQMQKILKEIESGAFARKWIREYEGGMRNYVRLKRQVAGHPIEKIGRRIRRLSE
jgi:ketol-acid reductoisomerase